MARVACDSEVEVDVESIVLLPVETRMRDSNNRRNVQVHTVTSIAKRHLGHILHSFHEE
jgi:hypothetical protein